MEIYVVATPIGNLEDITIRALKILRKVDIIFAEDSRITKKLLNRYKIKKKIISFHKFNEQKRIQQIESIISSNIKSIALVSDAGTPLISDPGEALIKYAFEKNFKITPIPGPSAISTLLSIIPFKISSFIFLGFLEKNILKRKNIIKQYLSQEIPFIFFESPKRIVSTVKIIKNFSESSLIFIGRELTKKFEEIISGFVSEVYENFLKREDIKGEIVVCVLPKTIKQSPKFIEDINILKELNISTKDIATFVSKKYNIKKNEIYNRIKNELY